VRTFRLLQFDDLNGAFKQQSRLSLKQLMTEKLVVISLELRAKRVVMIKLYFNSFVDFFLNYVLNIPTRLGN